MKQDGMYYKVTQEYFHLNREKRELVLKELREINLNIEVSGIFSIVANAILFIVMVIVLFK